MDHSQKTAEVAELKGTFTTATTAVVLEFKGLSVEKDTTFRKSIRNGKGQYRVAKNTMLRLAVKETAFESLGAHFKGASAVATTQDDVIALAKAISTFLKENPTAIFKAGVMDGKLISVKELQTLADLPSREVLIGKLLYLMQYPISGLAVALDQIRKQKEGAA